MCNAVTTGDNLHRVDDTGFINLPRVEEPRERILPDGASGGVVWLCSTWMDHYWTDILLIMLR